MELLHFAFRRVTEAPDRLLAQRGLGRLHHRILYVIAHNPRIEVGPVGELLGITKQAVHGPLRDLMDQGLVEVHRPEDDRRRKQLTLTSVGEELERRLALTEHQVFEEAFRDAGPEAVEGWRRVMQQLGGGRRLKL
jgi:DNA-binding MarR family transcriptional regulator